MKLFPTIRDLFWVALVIAMAVGWWIDRTNCLNSANENLKFEKSLSIERQAELMELVQRTRDNARIGDAMPIVPSLYESNDSKVEK